MQFSDQTNYSGILQRCEYYLFGEGNYGAITDSTERKKTFAAFSNTALNKVVSYILEADTKWEYDDTNHSTYPIGTRDLVAGQQDYTLSTSHLKILRVEVKNSDGNYVVIRPIDQTDIKETALSEYQETDGMPVYYDKMANSLFLYPAPAAASVTTSAGLKVYYQREPSYFSYEDTTKEPGFAEIYHELIPLWASFEYCFANQQYEKAAALDGQAKERVEQLQSFLSKRSKDEKEAIGTQRYSFK